jgi:2-haloacid dehalogenase
LTRFAEVRALSFDCYGTLIDWESGILGALRPVLSRHGIDCDDERLLGLYAAAESALEAGPYRPYRDVLREVTRRIAAELRFDPTAEELELLAGSLPGWPPFPDSVEALRILQTRFRLAIASNIDDDLFAATERRLGVTFDLVTTAQQVRSYKPAPAHLLRTLEKLGVVPKGKVVELVHVAQSLFHDIGPAKALGITTVWVNRRSGRSGPGATPQSAARPDYEVPDLRGLVALTDSAAG